MQTTVSLPLGTYKGCKALIFDDVVVSAEWYSGTQEVLIKIMGARDYDSDIRKSVTAEFTPAIEKALQAALDADAKLLAHIREKWNEQRQDVLDSTARNTLTRRVA